MQACVGLASACHRDHDQDGEVNDEKLCQHVLKTLEQRYNQRRIEFHLYECETLEVMAEIYLDRRDFGQAKSVATKALIGFERLNGNRSSGYLHSAEKLAIIHQEERELHEANKRWHQVVEGYSEALGPHHEKSLTALWRLGGLLLLLSTQCDIGKGSHTPITLKEAEKTCLEAYKGFSQMLELNNPSTMRAAQTLGEVYRKSGKFREAKQMFAYYNQFILHAAAGKSVEHDHAKARSVVDLAEAIGLVDDPRFRHRATELFQEGLTILGRYKPGHDLYDAHLRFGRLHQQREHFDDAATYLESAFNGFNQPGDSTKKLEAELILGLNKLLRHEADAKNRIEFAYRGIHKDPKADHFLRLEASKVYGELCMSQGMAAEGERELREVLRKYQNIGMPGHPTAIHVMNRLIGHYSSLSNQKQADDMRTRKFTILMETYGEDEASMIMHMTEPWVSPTAYRGVEKPGGAQRLNVNQHHGGSLGRDSHSIQHYTQIQHQGQGGNIGRGGDHVAHHPNQTQHQEQRGGYGTHNHIQTQHLEQIGAIGRGGDRDVHQHTQAQHLQQGRGYERRGDSGSGVSHHQAQLAYHRRQQGHNGRG